MSFELNARRKPGPRLGKVLARQLTTAAEELVAARDVDELVHAVRRHLKKSRAVLRISRKALGKRRFSELNTLLQGAGRELSAARDVAVTEEIVKGLGKDTALRPLGHALDPLTAELHRLHLVERRKLAAPRARERLAAALRAAAREIDTSSICKASWDDLDKGLRRIYRKARSALESAKSDTRAASLHELRKQVKYHRYAVQLLSPAWPAALGELETELHQLTDLLGAHHDNAVCREIVRSSLAASLDDDVRAAVLRCLEDRNEALARRALMLATRLYGEPPRAFSRRMHLYVARWRTEQSSMAAPATFAR